VSHPDAVFCSDDLVLPLARTARREPLGVCGVRLLLEVGFYYWETLERLPVLDAAGQARDDRVLLPQKVMVR
jgi:hypothetical protein